MSTEWRLVIYRCQNPDGLNLGELHLLVQGGQSGLSDWQNFMEQKYDGVWLSDFVHSVDNGWNCFEYLETKHISSEFANDLIKFADMQVWYGRD